MESNTSPCYHSIIWHFGIFLSHLTFTTALPSFRSHFSLCRSSNTPNTFLPQDLCTCFSPWFKYSSPCCISSLHSGLYQKTSKKTYFTVLCNPCVIQESFLVLKRNTLMCLDTVVNLKWQQIFKDSLQLLPSKVIVISSLFYSGPVCDLLWPVWCSPVVWLQARIQEILQLPLSFLWNPGACEETWASLLKRYMGENQCARPTAPPEAVSETTGGLSGLSNQNTSEESKFAT